MSADLAIIFVATTSGEGSDRLTLGLDPIYTELIRTVTKKQKNTVVVMVSPGAVLTDWAKSVAAVLVPLMPGQEYGNAIAELLFGDSNPSGRLPITFPNVDNEVGFTQSQYPGVSLSSTYSEQLEVGYRWYAVHQVTPAFAFGHGLSYTHFKYSDLIVNTDRTMTFDLQNDGGADGAEVPQLYLKFPDNVKEPPKQLKEFTKVFLQVGAQVTVTFKLTSRDLSIWDTDTHAWKEVSGSFGIMIGASSEDIRLTGAFVNKIQSSTLV